MNKVNKKALVDGIGGRFPILTYKHAGEVVDRVFDFITEKLAQGVAVNISGFGIFLVKKRKARVGVNPRTKERIQIKETLTPKFRAGDNLKKAVKAK